jgi:hypothetical protein
VFIKQTAATYGKLMQQRYGAAGAGLSEDAGCTRNSC